MEIDPKQVFKTIRKIDITVPDKLDVSRKLPVNMKEGIMFTLYTVGGSLEATKLMKFLDISHLKYKIPTEMNLSIWHYGPSDRLFYLYLKLLELEGFLERKLGSENQDGVRYSLYGLTEKGKKYVIEEMLPWDHYNDFKRTIVYLRRFPVGILAKYSEFLAKMKLENKNGKILIRIADMSDFSGNIHLQTWRKEITNPRLRIMLNTPSFASKDAERFYGGPRSWPLFEDGNNFDDEIEVNNLNETFIKKVPINFDGELYETKNYIVNKIHYVLSIYILSLSDLLNGQGRWIPLEVVKVITHDHRLQAMIQLQRSRSLNPMEKEKLNEQKKIGRYVLKDLRLLVSENVLEERKIRGKLYYKVVGRLITDGSSQICLPHPVVVNETYNVIFGVGDDNSSSGEWKILLNRIKELESENNKARR